MFLKTISTMKNACSLYSILSFLFFIYNILLLSQNRNNDFSFRIPNSPYHVQSLDQLSYEISDGISANKKFKKKLIKLNLHEFDPLVETKFAKNLSKKLFKTSDNNNIEKAYIVQFHTQIFEEYRNEFSLLGVEVHSILHDNSLIVFCNKDQIKNISTLPYVRWSGPYQPLYKLENGLQEYIYSKSSVNFNFSILLFKKEMQNKIIDEIKSIGGKLTLTTKGNRFEAELNANQLLKIVVLKEIMFIDRATLNSDDMDQIREIEGANYLESVGGYSGSGVAGEVFDDGLMTSHVDFLTNTPLIHGKNDVDNDHGTSVYGIIFGAGNGNNKARGLLPDSEKPIFSSRHHYSDRYSHTAELVDPQGSYRAVFQSNSWGSSETINYTTKSAELDNILFNHDIVVTQSQANEGTRYSRPQAWSKNVISVGGIHGRNTLKRSDDYWKSASIGPASDGRIKPDLANFYGLAFTTDNTSALGYSDLSGTSSATPVTAGYFGLLFQMWADGVFDGYPGKNRNVFDSKPHMTTAKAIMINMAHQYNFTGTNHNLTRAHQGWGFPDIHTIYETAKSYGWNLPILIDESNILKQLETHTYKIHSNGNLPLKFTMVYSDPMGNPASTKQLVNNIDLNVKSPSGIIFRGNSGLRTGNWSTTEEENDDTDNVENVFIELPERGEYTITIVGEEIIEDNHLETVQIDADYALVATGGYISNPININELKIQQSEGGEVFCHSNSTHFLENFNIKVYAEAEEGWEFVSWQGNNFDNENPLILNMDSDKTISAVFKNKYKIVGNSKISSKTSTSANRRAMKFTMPEQGNLNQVSIYHNGGSGKMIVGIYDGNITPQKRIGTTGEVSVSNSQGWQVVDLIDDVTMNNGEQFWISWVFENNPGIKYDNKSNGCVDASTTWISRLPETFGNSTLKNYSYSVYAIYTTEPVTKIKETDVPKYSYRLFNAYPNPFNTNTNINFEVPIGGRASLKVYDIIGKEISELINEKVNAGLYSIKFDASELSSGIYFYTLKVNEFISTKKMLFIK